MNYGVDEAAWTLWAYLHEHGPSTVDAFARDAGFPPNMTQRAIGWLVRENKLVIDRTHRAEVLRLRYDFEVTHPKPETGTIASRPQRR